MDISFFAFDLPWYRFVLGFAFATVVVGLIAAAVTHYLYGGLRLQPLLGERATPAARVHLSVLLGMFVLLKAVGYWLDRYGLAVDEHRIGKADFTGLTYTDVNAVLQGKTILAIISLICAVLFFANIVRRTWLLPGIGVGLLLLSALLDRRHLPGARPAVPGRRRREPDKEAPYIQRNIDGDADGVRHRRRRDRTTTTPTTDVPTRPAARRTSDTTASIRLLDPPLLSPTFRNLQQIRAYYDFPELAGRRPLHDRRRDAATS